MNWYVVTVSDWGCSTFVADICCEIDNWCRANCRGEYEIVDSTTFLFELDEDRSAFVADWLQNDTATLF